MVRSPVQLLPSPHLPSPSGGGKWSGTIAYVLLHERILLTAALAAIVVAVAVVRERQLPEWLALAFKAGTRETAAALVAGQVKRRSPLRVGLLIPLIISIVAVWAA